VRVHPLGHELRMLVDHEGAPGVLTLLWCEVYWPGSGRELGAVATEHKGPWLARGWQEAQLAGKST
jgi:hypothetical protein